MKKKKNKEIYSYMLRFNKGLSLDQQALENIAQFCQMTNMTMREAIVLMLATVDISALHDNILSLHAIPEKSHKGN